MTELSSEVIVLTYNPTVTTAPTELQYISTVPEEFDENNQGSAIHISSDGCFVYAGNRGHNSIAVYSVDQNSGQLTFVNIHLQKEIGEETLYQILLKSSLLLQMKSHIILCYFQEMNLQVS